MVLDKGSFTPTCDKTIWTLWECAGGGIVIMCRTKLDILAGLTICARDMQRWRLKTTLESHIAKCHSDLTFRDKHNVNIQFASLIAWSITTNEDKTKEHEVADQCPQYFYKATSSGRSEERRQIQKTSPLIQYCANGCRCPYVWRFAYLLPELFTESGFQLFKALSHNKYWLQVPAFLIKHQVVIITQFVRISLSRNKHDVVKIN